MVSLWRSKKANDQDDPESTQEPNEPREPDERTRLLSARHPPPRHDGYLDPDDPAVSPYNLWAVRFLRALTVLFLAVTFLWWLLLFVSTFVSPPMMHSRGSGFFDFAYTTLTIGMLLVSLLFFSSPSRAMRIEAVIVALLLLINMIIIVSVRRIREEEGWVGIASVVWAVLMAIWFHTTDRVVEWGKHEEEARLTGRPENRRTLKEWLLILVASSILVVYMVVVIFITATLTIRSYDAGLEMIGKRYYVDGDKYEVHLACVGNATSNGSTRSPTILLEAGEEPTEHDFEYWAYSAFTNGTIHRYCLWDRPGYGWSDNAPSPHSAGMSATALSEALAKAGEEGPWILVSAGYGSLVSRIFSSTHGQAVLGIMLVDGLHEDLLGRVGSSGRGFVLWGYGIISPLGIQRVIGALFQGRTREDRVYGRSAYQGGKFIKAQLQENLVAESLTRSEVLSATTIQRSNTPLVIVSSGIEVRKDSEWGRKQEELTRLTDRLLDWIVVKKAPHKVWTTDSGRTEMENGLAKLVREAKKQM